MPQLGCNYSKELMALLAKHRVNVDWIKLSNWREYDDDIRVARAERPVLLHVLPRAGSLPDDEISPDKLNEALRVCNSPHIALHLAATPMDWNEPVSDQQIIDRLVTVTEWWRNRVRVPLLIENMTYYGPDHGYIRCTSDPKVIQLVCTQTSVGLLLDIAHARIAAWNRGVDTQVYLEQLPLDLVREVHVNRPAIDQEIGYRDRHLELREPDYDLLAWVLERTSPQVVTLEYGGTGPDYEGRSVPEYIEAQLVRLEALCSTR